MATDSLSSALIEVAEQLRGNEPQVCLRSDLLNSFGPFTRRLLMASAEFHTNVFLEKLMDRVYALFVPCLELACGSAPTHSVSALPFQEAAETAAALVMDAALSHSNSSAVWCGVGSLLQRLVHASTSAAYNPDRTVAERRHASAVLLRRVPIPVCLQTNDELERIASLPDVECAAMVSTFTLVWEAVATFLGKLSTCVAMRSSRSAWQSIPFDCVVAMMESNHALLWEAHETRQCGAALEVLCVAANNLSFIRAKWPSMDGEAEGLLARCTARVLQDVADGCVSEMQQTLQMYLYGQQVTYGVLTARFAVARVVYDALAPRLPRERMMMFVLERTLKPVAEDLLDEHVETASAATKTKRLGDVLGLMEREETFGPVICEQCPTFCTLKRLFQALPSPVE